MDHTSIRRVLYFQFLLFLCATFSVSCAQSCSNEIGRDFSRGSLITQSLQICSNELFVMASVTSFLETCHFTSSSTASRFGVCLGNCIKQGDCVAMTYSATNGCELCMDTAGAPGNNSTYDVSRVTVNVPALQKYMNGKIFRFKCFLQSVRVVVCNV